jgi:hypothetical protein
VQNLVDLDMFARGEKPGLGQLKLTVAQFFRIDGGSTQHKGVSPDIEVPGDAGCGGLRREQPRQRAALGPDHAGRLRSGRLSPLLPLLQEQARGPSQADPEFRWWSEDVAEYRKQRAREDDLAQRGHAPHRARLREGAHILADAIDLLSADRQLAARVKSFDLHAPGATRVD